MPKRSDFYRPQIYFQRKEEIEALRNGFELSGSKSKSSYLHDLVMLGLKESGKIEEGGAKNEAQDLRDRIGMVSDGLNAVAESVLTLSSSQEKSLDSVREVVSVLTSRMDGIEKELSVIKKVLANIYQFTYPKMGASRKSADAGEYDELPGRLRQ